MFGMPENNILIYDFRSRQRRIRQGEFLILELSRAANDTNFANYDM